MSPKRAFWFSTWSGPRPRHRPWPNRIRIPSSICSSLSAQTGRSLLDALLVALCVALLLALGIMLRPQRGPQALPDAADLDEPFVPDDPDAPRQRLMSLGIALLLVSLGVCLYTMYRLGFCCMRREYNRARLRVSTTQWGFRLHTREWQGPLLSWTMRRVAG